MSLVYHYYDLKDLVFWHEAFKTGSRGHWFVKKRVKRVRREKRSEEGKKGKAD